MKHIITYDNKIIDISDEEYEKLCPIVGDANNKFCQIRGQTHNINNFKYMGDKKGAPIVNGWNNVPAGAEKYEENGFGQYLLEGDSSQIIGSLKKTRGLIWGKYTADEFREFAKKVWDDHRKRMGADSTKEAECLQAVRETRKI